MSQCKSLIGFPNGILTPAASPAAEDGAAASAADAPADGKHTPPHRQQHYYLTTKYTTNNDDFFYYIMPIPLAVRTIGLLTKTCLFDASCSSRSCLS